MELNFCTTQIIARWFFCWNFNLTTMCLLQVHLLLLFFLRHCDTIHRFQLVLMVKIIWNNMFTITTTTVEVQLIWISFFPMNDKTDFTLFPYILTGFPFAWTPASVSPSIEFRCFTIVKFRDIFLSYRLKSAHSVCVHIYLTQSMVCCSSSWIEWWF